MKAKLDYPNEKEIFTANLSGVPIDFGYVSSNNRLRLLSFCMKNNLITKTTLKSDVWSMSGAKDVYQVNIPIKYRDASCKPDGMICHEQNSYVVIRKARFEQVRVI